jgi:hypothetical protein
MHHRSAGSSAFAAMFTDQATLYPEKPVTAQPGEIPRAESARPAPGRPIRHARPPRLSWLRTLPLLARHIARLMPWATLITGCLAGTAVLEVVAHVAESAHWQLSQAAVRLAFASAIAALAFLPRGWFRPVTQATPVPAWVAPTGHIVLAVPVLAVTCWMQLLIMARTIPASAAQPAVYPLLAQLTGWCLVTIAIGACVDRSRYADLSGAIAAPLSLFVMAVAVYTPQINRHLFTPAATPHAVSVTWYAIAAVALALTCAAMRDHWHRYAPKRSPTAS